jgi:hypothetical protein
MPAKPSSPMKNVRPRNFLAWCLSLGFAGLTLAASAQSPPPGQTPNPNSSIVVPPDAPVQPEPAVQAQPSPDNWDRFWKIEKVSADDDWTRHFRIGAIVGLNIKANFKTEGTLPVSGNNVANGIFDDGHVIPDPANTEDNYTWNWGYQHADQLNGSTLTMHSTTSYTTSGSAEESGSAFPGFEMAYGGNLWLWKKARIGWEFGFGLLPISITDNHSMLATVHQDIYTFNTGGIDLTGLPPGYQGGPDGPSILNVLNLTGSTNIPGVNVTGSRTLDVILYTFRLGPTFYWDLNEDLGLMVGGGPALGLVSGSLKYHEITSPDAPPNTGRVDGTDVVYGGYVNAMLTYHVEKNGDLYVGVQYMPMGSASISGGGREARLNLDGQIYITAGINWPF